jgi:arabinan endo-1,5-alpha-L-arabinosidase
MRSRAALVGAVAAAMLAVVGRAGAQLSGQTGAHDPSTLEKVGNKYFYFATGNGIVSRSSTDEMFWTAGPSVFSTPPSWTTSAVPGFTGNFWAPDLIYLNGQYYLYYSVSTFGSQVSAIGLATNPTLDPSSPNYHWSDHGPVIQSTNGSAYNTIDPSIIKNTDGRVWLQFGSFWNGVYQTELDPASGMRLSPGTSPTRLAFNSSIEASYLYKRDGYYYLFVNWGQCCMGVNSTYNIRMGRSASVNGPFLDRNGVNMVNGGGSLFLANDSNRIGPGHMGIYSDAELDQFTYHYYNANTNGSATYGLKTLYWTSDGWPSYTPINPNWGGAFNSNWSQASNWVGGMPNGRGHAANFGSVSSGRYLVTLDAGPVTLGAANFSSTATYAIAGSGANQLVFDAVNSSASITVTAGNPTIAAPVQLNDNTFINISPALSTLSITGAIGGTCGITKSGSGILALWGSNTYSGATSLQAGTLKVTGAAAQANLLTASAGADITGGKLLLNYATDGADPADQVSSILASGFAQPIKFSSGALRTSYAPDSTKGLAWKDDTDNARVVVVYTWNGDANLDGVVNALDFNVMATNYGASGGTVWSSGDFNYDGIINSLDFASIAANFNQSLALPSSELASLVPEPVSTAIFAMIAMSLRRRSIAQFYR